MKKILSGLLVIISIGIFSCQASGNGAVGIRVLKPEDFKKKITELNNEIIVDVRAPKELSVGKIPNALNINFFETNFDAEIAKLDKSKPIMVYCAGGFRSAEAAKKLQSLGFKEIYDLEGGFDVYQAKGLDK